jgi:hypothetical protein
LELRLNSSFQEPASGPDPGFGATLSFTSMINAAICHWLLPLSMAHKRKSVFAFALKLSEAKDFVRKKNFFKINFFALLMQQS